MTWMSWTNMCIRVSCSLLIPRMFDRDNSIYYEKIFDMMHQHRIVILVAVFHPVHFTFLFSINDINHCRILYCFASIVLSYLVLLCAIGTTDKHLPENDEDCDDEEDGVITTVNRLKP